MIRATLRALFAPPKPTPPKPTPPKEDPMLVILMATNLDLREQVDRLTKALDVSTKLTENEDRAVRAVAAHAGETVREIATAMATEQGKWRNQSTWEPADYDVDRETKFIYNAFKKGHLRREPEGLTFRYWPAP